MITLTHSKDGVLTLPHPLRSSRLVLIPALCMGTIPHADYRLKVEGYSTVWVVRIPGVFRDRGILVDQGPLDCSAPLETHVFNLTNDVLRIPKGQAVSMLVEM